MSGFSFRVDNSPFNQQQAEALNQLLATLSPDQMIWLSGYLAGLRGGDRRREHRAAAGVAAEPAAPASLP